MHHVHAQVQAVQGAESGWAGRGHGRIDRDDSRQEAGWVRRYSQPAIAASNRAAAMHCGGSPCCGRGRGGGAVVGAHGSAGSTAGPAAPPTALAARGWSSGSLPPAQREQAGPGQRSGSISTKWAGGAPHAVFQAPPRHGCPPITCLQAEHHALGRRAGHRSVGGTEGPSLGCRHCDGHGLGSRRA